MLLYIYLGASVASLFCFLLLFYEVGKKAKKKNNSIWNRILGYSLTIIISFIPLLNLIFMFSIIFFYEEMLNELT